MCQRLRDILQPLNVLGKDIKNIQYPLSRTAFPINLTIKWTGDYLDAKWTIKKNSGKLAKADFHDKNQVDKTRIIPITPMGGDRAYSDLYFKCINVTSLIVNGETLI